MDGGPDGTTQKENGTLFGLLNLHRCNCACLAVCFCMCICGLKRMYVHMAVVKLENGCLSFWALDAGGRHPPTLALKAFRMAVAHVHNVSLFHEPPLLPCSPSPSPPPPQMVLHRPAGIRALFCFEWRCGLQAGGPCTHLFEKVENTACLRVPILRSSEAGRWKTVGNHPGTLVEPVEGEPVYCV